MRQKPTRKKQQLDEFPVTYGKVPPQSKETEEAILGGLMLQKNTIDLVLTYLKPEAFYVDAHRRIFSAIISLYSRSQPIDIITVTDQLRTTEELEIVGGAYYITKLTNHVVSDAHAEYYSRIVFQAYVKREMIKLGTKMIQQGYEDSTDIMDLIDESESDLFAIANALYKKNYTDLTSILVKAVREIEETRHKPETLSGITSGWKNVDDITNGWQKTDLIILAARPGVGKTAFALNLARNAAMAGTPVAFFSLEMSAGQLIRRLMSAESEIPLEKISKARLDEDGMKLLYARAIHPLSKAQIFIDESGGLNVFELRAKARQLVQKEKVGLIIVDYLQLMSGTDNNNRNREQEISEISRNLKKLAKELEVPLIALCQMSRNIENRNNKEPQLSDLRESGAIEQDADAVIFLSRPEYYGLHRDENGESNPGETILKFAKYRNGSPGSTKLRAQLWIQKFVQFETGLEATKEKLKKDGVSQVWQANEQVDKTDTTFK